MWISMLDKEIKIEVIDIIGDIYDVTKGNKCRKKR